MIFIRAKGGYTYHILRAKSSIHTMCGLMIIDGQTRSTHPGRNRICNRCYKIKQGKKRK